MCVVSQRPRSALSDGSAKAGLSPGDKSRPLAAMPAVLWASKQLQGDLQSTGESGDIGRISLVPFFCSYLTRLDICWHAVVDA